MSFAMGPIESLGSTMRTNDRLRMFPAAMAAEPSRDGWLGRAKASIYENFEGVIALLILGSLIFISSFVVHKFAFLLFYFIPVLMAGFYSNARNAVLTAVLAAGLVIYVTLLDPFGTKGLASKEALSFWNLLIWSSFLILTGAIVGKLQDMNRLRMQELRHAYVGIIQILTKFLESADAYTKSHSERVASISAVIARRLGLRPNDVDNVWTGALLHDIGKVEVIELIQKAAKLDPEERSKVDSHAQLGAELLRQTGAVLRDAVPMVMEHHTPFHDGGDSIPIGARIIAVADAYDAIVSDRPYRAGRSHWQAVKVLQEGAGYQFDPRVVEALEASEQLVLAAYRD